MSFLLDPILLIVSGYLIAFIEKNYISSDNRGKFRKIMIILTISLFWIIAGSLYLDLINIPFLGEYGQGNHFMWNSGIEIIGLKPIISTTKPTYEDPLNPLNILAIIMFMLYPLWLHLGIKMGNKKNITIS